MEHIHKENVQLISISIKMNKSEKLSSLIDIQNVERTINKIASSHTGSKETFQRENTKISLYCVT